MPRLKSDTLTIWGAVRLSDGEPVVSSVGAFRTTAEKWAFKIGNCRVVKLAEITKSGIGRDEERKPKPEPKPEPKAEPVHYNDLVQFRGHNGTNGRKAQEPTVARRRGRPPGSKNRPKGIYG